MKNCINNKYISGVWAAGLLFSLTLGGCDVSGLQDAAEDFGVVIGLEDINTTPTVMVTDAKTGELVSSDIQVTYDGPNGGDVIDIFSDPLVTQKITGGVFGFGIDNSVAPTETNPAKVQLILEAKGYVTTSKTITLTSTGISEFSLGMVSKGSPPTGVSSTKNSDGNADSEGTVQSNIVVESKNNRNQDSSGVQVTIPQGTVFQDESGARLTGKLETELTNYDPSDPGALTSFPFEANDEEVGAAIVAGISTVEVRDESGRVAASSVTNNSANKVASDDSYTFTYRLDEGYQVKEGDLLSFYTFNMISYAPYRYTSKRYDDIVVEDLGNGQLGVRVSVTQYPNAICVLRVVRQGETSPATVQINRNGQTGPVYGYVSAFGSYYALRFDDDESTHTIPAVPDIEYRVHLNHPVLVAMDTPWNFLSQGTTTLDLPAPPANQIDAKVNVAVACKNPDEKVRVTDIPSASVTYRKTNALVGTRWLLAKNLQWNYDKEKQVLTGGSFNVTSVEQNEEYRFKISYDGKQYEHDILITGPDFTYSNTIDDDICS